ncbi:MAG TPA: glutamine-hydrolyzing GMP synthase, partial [Phycisphaerae bacterium]|nr:glutamine-hydrolyzing GMP synthase [Phycisphaerae bacterium]
MDGQTIAILDFGAQYLQLIARRVREHHVHSLVFPATATAEQLHSHGVCGIILSGSHASAYQKNAPLPRPEIFKLGVPILGICYGMQAACQVLGGAVSPSSHGEFGRTRMETHASDPILAHVPKTTTVWMSHGDVVSDFGPEFVSLAGTAHCPSAVVKHVDRPIYGVQFHPEVTHTPEGGQILRNFLYEIC